MICKGVAKHNAILLRAVQLAELTRVGREPRVADEQGAIHVCPLEAVTARVVFGVRIPERGRAR
jgi:hypothetical protein